MAIAELKPDSRAVFVQKQRANVYSMMLILSLLFIMIGCLCMYLEMKAYDMKVKVPQNATASSTPKPVEPTPGTAAGLPNM